MSALVLEALFESASPRFLDEITGSQDSKALGSIAERWFKDSRPGMREQLLAYVGKSPLLSNHQPLIKRLFKLAEAARDDELMGAFLASFDRLTTKQLRTKTRWDPSSRQYETEQILTIDPKIPKGAAPTRNVPPVNGRCPPLPRFKHHLMSFSLSTRRYLQRRVWRYFRIIGKTEPDRYLTGVSMALARYRDENLRSTADLLASWGLMHALYHSSGVIEAGRAGFDVRPGAALGELAFAPAFVDHWKRSPLPGLRLLAQANARIVRNFAIHVLKTYHRGFVPELSVLRVLLDSPHEESQMYAAELLESASGLEKWTISMWLELLSTERPGVVHVLARIFRKHVAPARIDRDTALTLAMSPLTPIAEIGFETLRTREPSSNEELKSLLRIIEAPAHSVRMTATDWLVGVLGKSPFATPLHARSLIDASFEDVRSRGLRFILASSHLKSDLTLWSAMTETPYEDVRAALVSSIEAIKPDLPPASVQFVWASVILAVRRGHRAKPRAARQIAERIAHHPEDAPMLLPLLATLMRSLRAPERSAGLAALASAAFANPALRTAITTHIPVLELFPEEA